MNIYWNEKSIPALQGLPFADSYAARRAVIADVWKHWQVWSSFATVLAAHLLLIACTPPLPYRWLAIAASAALFAKLPFNHFLQVHVSRYTQSAN